MDSKDGNVTEQPSMLEIMSMLRSQHAATVEAMQAAHEKQMSAVMSRLESLETRSDQDVIVDKKPLTSAASPPSIPTGYEPKRTVSERMLKVPVFTKGGDFANWKTRFLTVASLDGLDILFKSPVPVHGLPEPHSSRLARAMLISALDDSMMEVIRGSDDGSPSSIWQALSLHFEGTSSFTIRDLHQQFYSMRMTSDMTLSSYIDSINQVTSRMSSAAHEVTDITKLSVFITGLHPRYREIIVYINTQADMTYAAATTLVIDFHRRDFGPPNEVVGEQSQVGMKLPGHALNTGSQDRYKDVLCRKCNNKGHYPSHCPQRSGPTGKKCTEKCAYCKRGFHHEADCRKKKADKEREAREAPAPPIAYATVPPVKEDTANESNDSEYYGWLATPMDSDNVDTTSLPIGSRSDYTITTTTIDGRPGSMLDMKAALQLDKRINDILCTPVAMSATVPIATMVVDSGCTPAHLVNSTEGLLNYRPSKEPPINQAGAGASPLTVIGTGYLEPWGRVKVVPDLRINLLSTSQLWKEKQWTTTLGEFCEIKDASGTLMASGKLQPSGLYHIEDTHVRVPTAYFTSTELNAGLSLLAPQPTASDATTPDAIAPKALLSVLTPLLEAHHRYGHLHLGGLKELKRLGLLPDVTLDELRKGYGTCAACLAAKSHRLPRYKISVPIRATYKGELTHSDVCGPMEVASTDGSRFFVVFVDDYTRTIRIYLMRTKDETLTAFKLYLQEMLQPEGLKPRILRSDNGGEYTSAEFTTFCKINGIQRELTNRYTSHQNGVAERAIRTITEMTLAQLTHAGLDRSWWGPSALHAAYTRNRCPTRSIQGRPNIPWTAWTTRIVDANLMIPFGVTGYVHVPDSLRTKLDTRAVKGVFLGCPDMRKGYQMWVPSTNQIIHSRDVTFEIDASGTREFCRADTGEVPQRLPLITQRIVKGMQRTAGETMKEQSVEKSSTTTAATVDIPIEPLMPPVGSNGTPIYANLQLSEMKRLTAAQLRTALAERGEKLTGKKPALRSRLEKLLLPAPVSTVPEASVPVVPPTTSDPPAATLPDMVAEESAADGHEFKALASEGLVLLASAIAHSSTAADVTPQSVYNTLDTLPWAYNTVQPGSSIARTLPTPNTFKEAMALPQAEDWRAAMDKELASLKAKGVYKVVPRTSHMSVLPTRWVFKVKESSDGTVDKLKARFVVKGFLQQFMVHYHETYAPVTRATSVRLILVLAAILRWKVDQMDADTAFLNALLKEIVFVEPPPGSDCPSGHVWRLIKALYGLKQSPKAWSDMVSAFMLSIGFLPTEGDICVFIRINAITGCVDAIVSAFVDDFKIAAKTSQERAAIKAQFSANFAMTDLGELKWYLGMRVKQTTGRTTVSQSLYTDTVLQLFHMSNCAPAPTPMTDIPVREDCPAADSPTQKDMAQYPYRKLIGCLMYLSYCTRPDIMLAVNKLARFVSNPGPAHWKAAKRVLRYLQGTRLLGLVFDGNQPPVLSGYVDASWAEADTDRRSTAGYLFHLGGSLVSWNSYTQHTVSRSSTEAEYMALSDACQELVWLRRMCGNLGAPQETVVLHEDNQSAIALADNGLRQHRRTKHIDVRFHFVCAQIGRSIVRLKHCKTDKMIADIFTKPLPERQFEILRALLPMTSV